MTTAQTTIHDEEAGWTPILSADGVHYCSPRCGGGTFCKKEWYDTAVRKADELAARMGRGWTPRIWENLGWHYAIQSDVAIITEGVGDYHAEIRSAKQFFGDAATPEDALGFAVQAARTHVARINADLAAILEAGDAPASPTSEQTDD